MSDPRARPIYRIQEMCIECERDPWDYPADCRYCGCCAECCGNQEECEECGEYKQECVCFDDDECCDCPPDAAGLPCPGRV